MRSFSTALVRPQTYVAYAREAANFAVFLARYPAGILDRRSDAGERCGDAVHDVPVLLLHGFGHNRSGWFVLERHLRAAGFTSIHTMNYQPYLDGVPALARRVAHRVERICALTGAERVHVVGHSMGGVLLRWYVQELGGDRRVARAITVASPHEGTWAALAAFGPSASDLRPGSRVVRRLQESARATDVEWTAYYSNVDLLVQPGTSALLRHPALAATNVLVKDWGHLSIVLAPDLAKSIVARLEACPSSAGSIEPATAAPPEAATAA